MEGPQRAAQHTKVHIDASQPTVVCLLVRVSLFFSLASPRTLLVRTYEYSGAVELIAALSFVSFCLLFAASYLFLFVCPFAVSAICCFLFRLRCYVFVVMSSVDGGRDAAFLPVSLVGLPFSLFDCLLFLLLLSRG